MLESCLLITFDDEQGRKPILEEIGPFVYKAVTVKDSVDFGTDKSNLKIDEDDGTITYRPR